MAAPLLYQRSQLARQFSSRQLSHRAMTSLSTIRTAVANSPEVAATGAHRRGPSLYLLLNLGGWLFFGAAVMIGWLEQYPWEVNLVIAPAYILFGFLLSLLLGLVYERLGAGPASFGRALAISVVGSYSAAVLWTAAFYYYRHFGARMVHSIVNGAPSSLEFPPEWIFDGTLDNSLPLFGWSLVRLGLLYNSALRAQREQALRAVAAARDAQL